jgi:hypothetical protein
MVRLERAGEDERRLITRWSAPGMAEERRPCARYKAPQVNSLDEEVEDDAADLLVPSA